MKKQKSQKIFFILFWILTVIITSIWSYENTDKLESIKSYFLKSKKPKVLANTEEVFVKPANSFMVEVSKVISLSEKTALQDFKNTKHIVLGGDKLHTKIVKNFWGVLVDFRGFSGGSFGEKFLKR